MTWYYAAEYSYGAMHGELPEIKTTDIYAT